MQIFVVLKLYVYMTGKSVFWKWIASLQSAFNCEVHEHNIFLSKFPNHVWYFDVVIVPREIRPSTTNHFWFFFGLNISVHTCINFHAYLTAFVCWRFLWHEYIIDWLLLVYVMARQDSSHYLHQKSLGVNVWTHWGWVMHIDGVLPKGPIGPFWQDTLDICISEVVTIGSRNGTESTYLGPWWLTLSWTLGDKTQRNLSQEILENMICKMMAILFRPQWVNVTHWHLYLPPH